MRLWARFIILLLSLSAAACATQPPRFRDEAAAKLDQLKLEGGERLRPAEYASVLQAFLKGDAYLMEGEQEEADRYFQLTVLKGEVLEQDVAAEKARRLAEAARLAEERRRAELERLARLEEERLAKAQVAERARREAAEAERRKARPVVKEPPQVASWTVRRGESLPLIASRPEVYGDRNLWPLIYRANRDQIRDPKHIWPGQVLRVPRNLGRDDFAEARRFAQERPLH
ncbi:LysM peptidoglycan-binding domain-containing protein [Geomonas subterranea]|uniref:LysM peptidoglycan-binding domain-containing protein n=1 Tax=Geomonas subterranea TaxID=2847989 RepID=A0ABX8LLZ4_9BACT|nr:LysM peptidoglycan-binding domain-containing protein [Geomonas subterranea]QXE92698.1 LysM peptidoglycan-binding domain-containing protein [Geomonas subterranea]QXM09203.1 LysM peptidoglycan-binding domain-containing protein [Geomonas subterranea]